MAARTLILGLGNEMLADDAAGVLAARRLREALAGRSDIEVLETPEHGLALLEFLIGYGEAVIIDAIQTGQHPAGTVVEINPADLREIPNPSPHFAGLPEIMGIGKRLGLRMPRRVRVVAIEVLDVQTLGGRMSPEVRCAVPLLCDTVLGLVEELSAPRRA